MIKIFSYKLYNQRNNKFLHNQINAAGVIWNHCISLHNKYYKSFNKYLNKFQLQKHLSSIRGRSEVPSIGKQKLVYDSLNLLGSQAIQEITDRIHKGYQAFFKWCAAHKSGKKSGRLVRPPTFKKRFKYKSFTLKQAGYNLLGLNDEKQNNWKDNKKKQGKIIINKIPYKFYYSRPVDGNIKTLTVKRDSLGDIYIHFSCDNCSKVDPKIKAASGKTAGFDFGLKTFLTLSNGKKQLSPMFYKIFLKNIQVANKSLSRKHKGSSNRKRARLVLARIHKKIKNKRNNFHWQLALQLANEYDFLFFETLNLEGMKKLWGRKISDLGFGDFLIILKYVCLIKGKTISFIDKWYPSSRLCSECGCINENLCLKDREWNCPDCGAFHDRDLNAAINIEREGIRAIGGMPKNLNSTRVEADRTLSVNLEEVRRVTSAFLD